MGLAEVVDQSALVLDQYLDLLLSMKMPRQALEAAGKHDLGILPAWLLANLASTALSENQIPFANHMIESVGDDFLDEFPVL